jgi:predicted GNAT superfamily acetyltransferase
MTRTNLNIVRDDGIVIRRAETIADYRLCQDAQRRAWGITEEGYLIPVATMVGANLHGGLVLGAFLGTRSAVAMSFAFLGRIDGRICLYSQLTGVVPDYQSRGLGHQIKLLQRDFARAEGIERIAWAFDPLQAGNAHFNLGRLGATAGRYIDNMYGERTDALNSGVPTDRLIVEWDTRSEAIGPVAPCATSELPHLIRTDAEQGSDRSPGGTSGPVCVGAMLGEPGVLLEIPIAIATLRREQPALAEKWRLAVRQAFRAAFGAGYRAVHFIRDEATQPPRGFYLLERESGR